MEQCVFTAALLSPTSSTHALPCWKNTFIHITDSIELKTQTVQHRLERLFWQSGDWTANVLGEAVVCRLREDICKAGTVNMCRLNTPSGRLYFVPFQSYWCFLVPLRGRKQQLRVKFSADSHIKWDCLSHRVSNDSKQTFHVVQCSLKFKQPHFHTHLSCGTVLYLSRFSDFHVTPVSWEDYETMGPWTCRRPVILSPSCIVVSSVVLCFWSVNVKFERHFAGKVSVGLFSNPSVPNFAGAAFKYYT